MTYTEFLDNSPMTPFLWLLLIGVALAQILDGIDFQSTAFALPLVSREFRINPTSAGLIGSMTNVGLLLGAAAIFGVTLMVQQDTKAPLQPGDPASSVLNRVEYGDRT